MSKHLQDRIDKMALKKKALLNQRALMADEKTKDVFFYQLTDLKDRYINAGDQLDVTDPKDITTVSALQSERRVLKENIARFSILYINGEIKRLDIEIKKVQLTISQTKANESYSKLGRRNRPGAGMRQ